MKTNNGCTVYYAKAFQGKGHDSGPRLLKIYHCHACSHIRKVVMSCSICLFLWVWLLQLFQSNLKITVGWIQDSKLHRSPLCSSLRPKEMTCLGLALRILLLLLCITCLTVLNSTWPPVDCHQVLVMSDKFKRRTLS